MYYVIPVSPGLLFFSLCHRGMESGIIQAYLQITIKVLASPHLPITIIFYTKETTRQDHYFRINYSSEMKSKE